MAGQFLIEEWEMSNLSAYGLACFFVCQISNIAMRLFAGEGSTSDGTVAGSFPPAATPKEKRK